MSKNICKNPYPGNHKSHVKSLFKKSGNPESYFLLYRNYEVLNNVVGKGGHWKTTGMCIYKENTPNEDFSLL